MALDGLFVHAMVGELKQNLLGGRIQKIQQPQELELLMTVKKNRQQKKLSLSAHASFPCVHLTQNKYSIPTEPYNFCMVLRKYILGSQITKIEQVANDRIIYFELYLRDEFGEDQLYRLILELMGKHSNISLVDKNGIILDCIKHVPPFKNSYRTLLPGGKYFFPPQQNKVDPFREENQNYIQELKPDAKEMVTTFLGFGTMSGRELAYRLKKAPNNKLQSFKEFLTDLDDPSPNLVNNEKQISYFPIDYQSIKQEKVYFDSLGALLDHVREERANLQKSNQLAKEIQRALDQRLKHLKKKQDNFHKDQEKIDKMENYRIKGEVLTANLYQIADNSSEVKLINFYNNEPITITLDPTISPATNAQKLFERYNKLKRKKHYLKKQKVVLENELEYLDSLQVQLDLAQQEDLPEIKEELEDQGYIKKQKSRRKKQKSPMSQPRTFKSSEGNQIHVGRNNKQNDHLTFKKANKKHYWFHTKNIPGSHVILATETPTDTEIIEAAALAARFSKYSQSRNVPVDYTQVRHVKKPSGGKPGFVNYFEQKTVYVDPAGT